MTRTEAEMTVHNNYRSAAFFILRKLQKGMCGYCGVDFVPLTIEHIVPLSQGGEPYRMDNLLLACMHCNQAKGDRTRESFERWLNYVKYDFKGVPTVELE